MSNKHLSLVFLSCLALLITAPFFITWADQAAGGQSDAAASAQRPGEIKVE